jgi:hypothetical protein
MEWVKMPRSEEEVLATLDPQIYTENFDPIAHMLVGWTVTIWVGPNYVLKSRWLSQESFPADVEDFVGYVDRQLSEKDIAKEHIMAQLATRVEANYHVLIEGMKNIQEVDVDLAWAAVQSLNSRRKLGSADDGMRKMYLKVLHKRIRRENLQRVASIAKGAWPHPTHTSG